MSPLDKQYTVLKKILVMDYRRLIFQPIYDLKQWASFIGQRIALSPAQNSTAYFSKTAIALAHTKKQIHKLELLCVKSLFEIRQIVLRRDVIP